METLQGNHNLTDIERHFRNDRESILSHDSIETYLFLKRRLEAFDSNESSVSDHSPLVKGNIISSQWSEICAADCEGSSGLIDRLVKVRGMITNSIQSNVLCRNQPRFQWHIRICSFPRPRMELPSQSYISLMLLEVSLSHSLLGHFYRSFSIDHTMEVWVFFAIRVWQAYRFSSGVDTDLDGAITFARSLRMGFKLNEETTNETMRKWRVNFNQQVHLVWRNKWKLDWRWTRNQWRMSILQWINGVTLISFIPPFPLYGKSKSKRFSSTNDSFSFLSQSYSWLLISAVILIIFCIVSVFGRNAYQVGSFLLELVFDLSFSSGETSNWILDGSRSNRSLHSNGVNSPYEWVNSRY